MSPAPAAHGTRSAAGAKFGWWVVLALLVLAAALYAPVRHFEFLNFDDDVFLAENPWLKKCLTPDSWRWAWLANLTEHSADAEYWSPLTLLSRLLDAQCFGMNPGAFHVTSAVLHGLTAAVLFLACWKLTGHRVRSAAVAALFLVHPLNVEAACWLSARKDVLSGFFFCLSLLAYAHYVQKQSRFRYGLLLLAFLCCLMSKPMGVSLPFVLLLLDGWPLRRWPAHLRTQSSEAWRLFAEKLPLLILAALAAALAWVSQRDWGALADSTHFPFWVRAGNAAVSYCIYLRRMFWPTDLTLYYPHPGLSLSWGRATLAAVVLGVLSLGCWQYRKRAPYLLAGWLWFGIVLGPVIGLVQIGGQAMADRYIYTAMPGLLLAGVWAAAEFLPRAASAVAGCVALASCFAISAAQISTWRNSETAFTHALQVTPDNAVAYLHLGLAHRDRGALAQARAEFAEVVRLLPQKDIGWCLLAQTEARQGDDRLAEQHYQRVLKGNPDQDQALLGLGRLLRKHGNFASAEPLFRHIIELEPQVPQPYQELGEIYAAQHRWQEARQAWQAYLQIRPEDAEMRRRLAELPLS